jgi:hypothetical protein
LSGGPPPFGSSCGISDSGADDWGVPDAVGCVGLTARTGRAQSVELIDSPASEVGEIMMDTLALRSEFQVNAADVLSVIQTISPSIPARPVQQYTTRLAEPSGNEW